MRASCMSINRIDVQQAVKEVARFMAEPNEGAWIMLKRLFRYFVGHGRLVQVILEQRYVKAPRVDTTATTPDACFPVRARAHLFHGVNLIKAGSWTAREVCVLLSWSFTQESKALAKMLRSVF